MKTTKSKVITDEKTICTFSYTVLEREPDVLTVSDISRILRIGRNKAYELLHNGLIKSITVGGKIIVPKKSVIDFLGMAS